MKLLLPITLIVSLAIVPTLSSASSSSSSSSYSSSAMPIPLSPELRNLAERVMGKPISPQAEAHLAKMHENGASTKMQRIQDERDDLDAIAAAVANQVTLKDIKNKPYIGFSNVLNLTKVLASGQIREWMKHPETLNQPALLTGSISMALFFELEDQLEEILNVACDNKFDTAKIINGMVDEETSPLHATAYHGLIKATQILIRHGANPNVVCRGKTVSQGLDELSKSRSLSRETSTTLKKIIDAEIERRASSSSSSSSTTSSSSSSTPVPTADELNGFFGSISGAISPQALAQLANLHKNMPPEPSRTRSQRRSISHTMKKSGIKPADLDRAADLDRVYYDDARNNFKTAMDIMTDKPSPTTTTSPTASPYDNSGEGWCFQAETLDSLIDEAVQNIQGNPEISDSDIKKNVACFTHLCVRFNRADKLREFFKIIRNIRSHINIKEIIKVITTEQHSPLHTAVEREQSDNVELLLEYGADPLALCRGKTPRLILKEKAESIERDRIEKLLTNKIRENALGAVAEIKSKKAAARSSSTTSSAREMFDMFSKPTMHVETTPGIPTDTASKSATHRPSDGIDLDPDNEHETFDDWAVRNRNSSLMNPQNDAGLQPFIEETSRSVQAAIPEITDGKEEAAPTTTTPEQQKKKKLTQQERDAERARIKAENRTKDEEKRKKRKEEEKLLEVRRAQERADFLERQKRLEEQVRENKERQKKARQEKLAVEARLREENFLAVEKAHQEKLATEARQREEEAKKKQVAPWVVPASMVTPPAPTVVQIPTPTAQPVAATAHVAVMATPLTTPTSLSSVPSASAVIVVTPPAVSHKVGMKESFGSTPPTVTTHLAPLTSVSPEQLLAQGTAPGYGVAIPRREGPLTLDDLFEALNTPEGQPANTKLMEMCLRDRYPAPPIDMNGRNALGLTPLMVAAENGKCDAVELLLERRANPHLTEGIKEENAFDKAVALSTARPGYAKSLMLLGKKATNGQLLASLLQVMNYRSPGKI